MQQTLHSVVDILIAEGAPGMSLPFLFLENGELSLLALAWTRKKMLDEEVAPSSLAKAVAAIGRLYDFYQVERHGAVLAPEELRLMLKQFYEARRFGLASLGWEPVKVDTAAADVRTISEFTDWCSENFGHASVNERESVFVSSLNLAAQKAFQLKLSSRKNWAFLYHLTPSTQEGKGVTRRRSFNPKRGKSKPTSANKHYPPQGVWSTIAATPSVRDKLYLLLLFFSSVRVSEPLHLYASDVSILQDGTARVVFGNPQDGAYEWVGADKRRRRGNRATFLLERYGLGPRNVLASTHPLHAGWKGMVADDGKRSESVVHWLREDASRLFAKLHAEYVRTVRSKVPDTHPYYFVNEHGDTYGQPLKLSNVSKAFDRAAERVGLSVDEDGVNPHGGRHFYGYYCASVLRLPIETTQKMMHHKSILSTEIYYALTTEVVRAELLAAQEKQALEAPGLLAAPLSPMQLAQFTK